MAGYAVAYDLKKVGQNYNCLTAKLKSYPLNWRMQGSVWIIVTNETAAQIRDKLTPCLDGNDELMVLGLDGEAAWQGYGGSQLSPWMTNIQKRS